MLNVVPRKTSVSDSLSPMELLTGRSLDYNKHCQLAPDTYCLVHEKHVPRNLMRERATGAIAIGPTPSLQGTYHFISLKSGRIITRREWTVIPILPEAKVEEMTGEGDVNITFDYRGTTYSTHDLEAPLSEEDDSTETGDCLLQYKNENEEEVTNPMGEMRMKA